jgi:hypothetical protein
MHRLERDNFRTVHSLFTPMALESTCAQSLVNSVLDYLFYLDAESPPPPASRSDRMSGGGE